MYIAETLLGWQVEIVTDPEEEPEELDEDEVVVNLPELEDLPEEPPDEEDEPPEDELEDLPEDPPDEEEDPPDELLEVGSAQGLTQITFRTLESTSSPAPPLVNKTIL
jgi:hypothetical protein